MVLLIRTGSSHISFASVTSHSINEHPPRERRFISSLSRYRLWLQENADQAREDIKPSPAQRIASRAVTAPVLYNCGWE